MLAAGREAYAWCRECGLQNHIDIEQLGSRAGMYYSLINRRSHFLFRYFGRKWHGNAGLRVADMTMA
jgi:hypothetical protein